MIRSTSRTRTSDLTCIRCRPCGIKASDQGEQDLVYYESPPGLQLLHCMKFDEGCAIFCVMFEYLFSVYISIQGGDSTFADAIQAAELLKKTDKVFDLLLFFTSSLIHELKGSIRHACPGSCHVPEDSLCEGISGSPQGSLLFLLFSLLLLVRSLVTISSLLPSLVGLSC